MYVISTFPSTLYHVFASKLVVELVHSPGFPSVSVPTFVHLSAAEEETPDFVVYTKY